MPHVEFRGSDGKIWPSATTLTSLLPQEWVWAWYRQAVFKHGKRGWQRCLAQTKRGGLIGTEVHGLIEGFIKKEAYPISGKYESERFADALFDKVNPLVTEWVALEPHLKSEVLKIHGTADAIVKWSPQPELWENVVLDWKTSAAKSETHPIQLAIYAYCWNESKKGIENHVSKGIIARVDKKSKRLGVKIDEYANLEQYYPVIEALRTIWQYSQGTEE